MVTYKALKEDLVCLFRKGFFVCTAELAGTYRMRNMHFSYGILAASKDETDGDEEVMEQLSDGAMALYSSLYLIHFFLLIKH